VLFGFFSFDKKLDHLNKKAEKNRSLIGQQTWAGLDTPYGIPIIVLFFCFLLCTNRFKN
jgi:hypothetical protein